LLSTVLGRLEEADADFESAADFWVTSRVAQTPGIESDVCAGSPPLDRALKSVAFKMAARRRGAI
jgi:hypothetical protein